LHQRYRLLKPLGQGGFGKTFLAQDEYQSTKALCVVKQILPNHNNPQVTERFQQETQRLAEVGEHPQIPQLLNHFEQDGQCFIVQEWIDGSTLEQEAVEQLFDEGEVWALLRDLLPILQYLHDRNIIHRDIKPANIIRRRHTGATDCSSHSFVLVDFGAAKQIDEMQPVSTGTIIGSAEYAAPEQIRGRAVFASDLYSLGVTCLHLLTQMSPFELYDVGDAIWKWEAYLTQPISTALKHMLCTLVQPAMRRRYQSAAEAFVALEALTLQPAKRIAPSALALTSSGVDGDCMSCVVSPAAIAANYTIQTVRSIKAATAYNPQSQRWHSLPSATVPNNLTCDVAVFLRSRLLNTSAPHTDRGSPTNLMAPKHLMSWRLVAVGFGTAVASVALTCLWVCVSIIFLALAVPPQSTTMPAKVTSSVLPRSL
jgi:serine/threonine protein kinase